MRKTSARKKGGTAPDSFLREYRFDYRRAKPNGFAQEMSEPIITVVLEPDVAAVFKSSRAVNALLRSAIASMPERERHTG
jgi:hypothetical protein